ncbi:MAG: hypothetical protein K9N21_20315 [Deltaproteobacteria bacterium]|nr:hypothetical protein [Deltaproteobacteria bacterium]
MQRQLASVLTGLSIFLLSNQSYGQDAAIEGKVMSGNVPVTNAEIEVYAGKEKNPMEILRTDKEGKFKINWKKVDLHIDTTPSRNISLQKERIGRNRWKIIIDETRTVSFGKEFKKLISLVLTFIVGWFGGSISKNISHTIKKRRFRKRDLPPTKEAVSKMLSDIKSRVLEKEFAGEILNSTLKRVRKISKEVSSLLDGNTDLKEYDRKSYDRLRHVTGDLQFMEGFLGEDRSQQDRLFIYYNDKSRAISDFPELSSYMDSLHSF